MQPPKILSDAQVQRCFKDAPSVKKATLALVYGRMYRREPDGWRLLDDKPRATVREFTDGSS
jgi:hypothetical protein